jgi:predicted nucleotidyltransferase
MTVTRAEIDAIARRIAEEFKPERIILFGSHATGSTHGDSDIDLLVVLPFQGPRFRTAGRIRSRLTGDLPLDVVVRTPEEYATAARNGDILTVEALRSGRVLFPVAA